MLQQFFDALKPRLEISRKVEEKLCREFAHRFNVLKCLDAKEKNLSHMIKDLLDPKGCHGQGSFFLKMLLEKLDIDPKKIGLNLDNAGAFREYTIKNGKRIDIYIEIPSNNGEYCLAFENKPRAGDDPRQVIDYLDYLCGKFGANRFWLIYLSPRGEPPGEISLPRVNIEDGQWVGSLKVMAYANPRNEENGFRNYRAPCSFVDWIVTCHEKCRVGKLRRFLKDIETYCKKEIGDQTMPNDIDTETVKDFLFEDSGRLEIAQRVFDSWPIVRDHVCEMFLEHLIERIIDKMNEPESLDEFCNVNICYIWYRTQIVGVNLSLPNWNDPEISIRLWHDISPYKVWFFCVYLLGWDRENNENYQLGLDLVDQLDRGGLHNHYPWRNDVEGYSDWNCIIPELYRESRDQGGDIADYFVGEFVRVSREAIPIIDNWHPRNRHPV